MCLKRQRETHDIIANTIQQLDQNTLITPQLKDKFSVATKRARDHVECVAKALFQLKVYEPSKLNHEIEEPGKNLFLSEQFDGVVLRYLYGTMDEKKGLIWYLYWVNPSSKEVLIEELRELIGELPDYAIDNYASWVYSFFLEKKRKDKLEETVTGLMVEYEALRS